MKTSLGLFLLLFCVCPSVSVSGQDDYGGAFDQDYYNTFGDEGGSTSEDTGSRTLLEAIETGRGYRIGSRGTYSMPNFHTVKKGDTLWDITDQYYGNPWQWPQVWSYNPEITNPHWIYPLDQIRLRSLTDLQETPLDPNIAETVSNKSNKRAIVLQSYGYLDEEALHTVGRIYGADEEHMMLSPSDVVYIKFKPGQKVQIGKPYTVFRKIGKSERNPEEQGTLVRIFGTVEIDDYDRKKRIARGVIANSVDPIERGYQIAVLDTRFSVVPPKTNQRNVEATVVASIRPRHLIGSYQVVFVDVGRDKGVVPGNRFIVVRRGDEWQQSLFTSVEDMGGIYDLPEYRKQDYPRKEVAVLRVIRVRKKTSVALVTDSITDIKIGDKVLMKKGF